MDAKKARLILREDSEDQEFFTEITTADITGDSRWSKFYEQVFKDTRDETFWEISWSRGATEYQDNGVEDVSVQQVWPHLVTTTVYKNKPY
jgi:hypothetical protein